MARKAYAEYIREARAEGIDGDPMNYQRWLIEYGYDRDDDAPAVCSHCGNAHDPDVSAAIAEEATW